MSYAEVRKGCHATKGKFKNPGAVNTTDLLGLAGQSKLMILVSDYQPPAF
jgi:hypothetical protein